MNHRSLLIAICLVSVACAKGVASGAVVAEFDASRAGAGVTPAGDKGGWTVAASPGVEMTNDGKSLHQRPSDKPGETVYINYLSPPRDGLMNAGNGEYGIEFRVQPRRDMPNQGASHFGNLVVYWSDETASYNVSIDQDSDDAGPALTGGLRAGGNSMLSVAEGIDWSAPRTVFVGYRGSTDAFEVSVDGKAVGTIPRKLIARDKAPEALNRVAFGDTTTGQAAPHGDLEAKWFFVRLHDGASAPGASAAPSTPRSPSSAPVAAATAASSVIGLYGTVCDTEEETVRLIDKCKAHGVNVLLPSLSGGSTVIWKTDKEEYYPSLRAKLAGGYDGLAVLIKYAHAAGIKVIPSVAVGPLGRALDQHPEWETRDRLGRPSAETTTRTLSFAYPEARAAKIAVMMDLVSGYEIDGVLLDYCRYPENSKTEQTKYGYYGYDQPLIDACQRLYGFDPRKATIDSPDWVAFNNLRADTVTALVKEFRDAAKGLKPHLIIAGFGDTDPDLERRSCARDWPAWGARGLIEDFYLATYTEKPEQMEAVVRRARGALGGRVRLFAALTPFNDFVTTNDTMTRIAAQQLSGGADGVWVYRQDSLEKLNLWPGVRLAGELVRRRGAQQQ